MSAAEFEVEELKVMMGSILRYIGDYLDDPNHIAILLKHLSEALTELQTRELDPMTRRMGLQLDSVRDSTGTFDVHFYGPHPDYVQTFLLYDYRSDRGYTPAVQDFLAKILL